MEKNLFKTIRDCLWNITKASLLTLILYILLYAIWGAILSSISSADLALIILCVCTEAAFCFVLIWVSYIKSEKGEDVVVKQYKDKSYSGLWNDIKMCLSTEKIYLALFWGLNIFFYFFVLLEKSIFQRRILSNIALLYTPLNILIVVFKYEIIGYLLSSLLISVLYLLFLGFMRKKWYSKWYSKK